MEVSIERSDCISCGLCVSTCPDVFRIAEDGLAEVYRQPGPAHLPAVKSAAEGCPVSIIYLLTAPQKTPCAFGATSIRKLTPAEKSCFPVGAAL